MRFRWLLIIAIVISVVFTYLPTPQAARAADIITRDSFGNVGQYSSIAVGSGDFAITYYDATNGNLKLIYPCGAVGCYVFRTLDSTGDVGQYTSLVLLNYDYVVSYYDVT